MAQSSEFMIQGDDQLRSYGIYTTDNADQFEAGEPALTRQDFRDVQEETLDTYPTDDVFLRSVIAAIELSIDKNLATNWGGWSQAASYVFERRPSQPDFLLPISTAAAVYSQSRFRTGVLQYPHFPETARRKIVVLREALARKSLEAVMTMEEYERPMRASGGVFISPRWMRRALGASPQVLTLDDFKRRAGRQYTDEGLARIAFSQLGAKLLDEKRSDHPAAHAYVSKHYFNVDEDRWNEGEDLSDAAFSFDLIAAYNAAINDTDTAVRGIAQKAIMSKIPGSWFRNGRFVPPPQEADFDF